MKTFDATLPIWISLLFMHVSNEWRHYYFTSFLLSILVWFCSLFIPESPSFLLSQNKFEEAKSVVQQISKVNEKPGKIMQCFFDRFTFIFVESGKLTIVSLWSKKLQKGCTNQVRPKQQPQQQPQQQQQQQWTARTAPAPRSN